MLIAADVAILRVCHLLVGCAAQIAVVRGKEDVMYLSIVMLKVQPGMRKRMEKFADMTLAAMSRAKGFKTMTFASDPETNEYGSISTWESKEDAKAVAAAASQSIQQGIGDILVGEPRRSLLEIYEPKI